MENKWCYSYNAENYYGDLNTKEEAIEEAKSEYGDDYNVIYVGQAVRPNTSVSADHLIDEIYESVRDECGEYAEGYLERVDPKDQSILEERINEVVGKWLKEFKYEPTFYTVTNVEEIQINA